MEFISKNSNNANIRPPPVTSFHGNCVFAFCWHQESTYCKKAWLVFHSESGPRSTAANVAICRYERRSDRLFDHVLIDTDRPWQKTALLSDRLFDHVLIDTGRPLQKTTPAKCSTFRSRADRHRSTATKDGLAQWSIFRSRVDRHRSTGQILFDWLPADLAECLGRNCFSVVQVEELSLNQKSVCRTVENSSFWFPLRSKLDPQEWS
jgi:hypothetical protein